MAGLQKDKRPLAGWRPRPSMIVAVVLGVIAMTVFFDDAVVAYQTWRHGAPGIVQGATEDARSVASSFWPFARTVCADPAVSARELGEKNPVSEYRLWNGGYDLTRRIGLIELRQRRLYGHRWDQGWMLQSLTVGGTLEGVVVERRRLGPADGPAPSTLAVYDKDCGLIGASYSELDDVPAGSWEWRRMCFGPGWVETGCDALDSALGHIVDVANASFDEEEKHCFDDTWSQAVPC